MKGPLASVYSAWWDQKGQREAWKQRLCVSCVTHILETLRASALGNSLDLTVCLTCGKDASQELNPIYLTVYLPKREAAEYALTICDSCAIRSRALLSTGADRLPERNKIDEGDDPWATVPV